MNAILAMGSELKNTFCLLRDGQAIISQHIGDLENVLAQEAYEKTINLYLGLLEHEPKAIAVDKHPEYLSTKLGKEIAEAGNLQLYQIQHHHAHIAACLVENGISLETKPVLGIALDGLGYGEDGTFWGGEFLLADYTGFQRLATFKPVAMLGGEQAIYQPWRNTYAHLKAALGEKLEKYQDLELFAFLRSKPLGLLEQMVRKKINAPFASSCGRLFDAVAAAIGVCREQVSYEGQAAIYLETLAAEYLLSKSKEIEGYPFKIDTIKSGSLAILEPRNMWEALLIDLGDNVGKREMAAKFHLGLGKAIASMVAYLSDSYRFSQVALTGGVFQNQILLQEVKQVLTGMGLEVLTHSQVPANDGGISLGQAAIAAVWGNRFTTNF